MIVLHFAPFGKKLFHGMMITSDLICSEKMVFYFTCDVVDPPVTLFMGLDKYENEDLIKAGNRIF